jgi:hypothetical protein
VAAVSHIFYGLQRLKVGIRLVPVWLKNSAAAYGFEKMVVQAYGGDFGF